MAKTKPKPWRAHTDPALIAAYKGYQGAHPSDACIIVLGKDANFPDPLTPAGIRTDVLDYLKKSSAFWAHGRGHHPYNRTNGHHRGVSPIRYHNKIETHVLPPAFPNPCTPYISFVELLWYPTIGNSGNSRPQWKKRLCSSAPGAGTHFANLHSWICDDSKLVLVPKGMVSLLCDLQQRFCDPIPCVDWCNLNVKIKGVATERLPQQFGHIVVHTHFSNAISNAEFGRLQQIVARHVPC